MTSKTIDKWLKLTEEINHKLYNSEIFSEYGFEFYFQTNGNEKQVTFGFENAILSTIDGPSDHVEMLKVIKDLNIIYTKLEDIIRQHFKDMTNNEIEKEYGIGAK